MTNHVKKTVEIVPANFTSVTPWIVSRSTSQLIDFLTNDFEAEEIPHSRIKNKEGVVINAVVKIGTAMVMLFDSREGWSPTPSLLNLYVEDVDKVYRASLKLGATSVTDITIMYFGEKVCRILDPFGNIWWLNQRIEEIEPAEIKRRAAAPEAATGIAYIQKSLDEALRAQKAFFAEAA
jgi:PhnB protein